MLFSNAYAEFLSRYPEHTERVASRIWGVIDTGPAGCQGTGLLLLPGTLGRASIFWQQIGELAGTCRVISMTYPCSSNLQLMARDLAIILRRRDITRVVVLGSSLGGYLGQVFAARYPRLVTELIAANTLVDVKPLLSIPPYNLDILHTPISRIREIMAGKYASWEQSHPDQKELVEYLRAEIGGQIPASRLKARLQAIKTAPPIPPFPPDGPRVTVVECADDPQISATVQASLRNRYAAATVYRFRAGGHFPYLVRARSYTGILRERLNLTSNETEWRGQRVREI